MRCIPLIGHLFVLILIDQSNAKLTWKCQLLDTSNENSTVRSTFIEALQPGKVVEPQRAPRSPKCRPRTHNDLRDPSSTNQSPPKDRKDGLRKVTISKTLEVSGAQNPTVKYKRKSSNEPTGKNNGPGFEMSNDENRKNPKIPPKRYKPSSLMTPKELGEPVAQQLDENLMPDFEIEGDVGESPMEDLPWCPEEPEESSTGGPDNSRNMAPSSVAPKIRCDSADVTKMSAEEFEEYRKMCGTTTKSKSRQISPKDCNTIDKESLDKKELLEYNRVCNSNCENIDSENISEAERLRILRNCKENLELIKELAVTPKPDSLDPNLTTTTVIPEKNVTSGHSKENHEPKSFPKKNCTEMGENLGILTKEEFMKYRKECLSSRIETKVPGNEMSEICREMSRRVEGMNEKEFEEYRKKCVVTRAPESLIDCMRIYSQPRSDSEIQKYREKCECEQEMSKLRGEALKEFHKRCVTTVPTEKNPKSPIRNNERCKKEAERVGSMSRKELEEFKGTCSLEEEMCLNLYRIEITPRQLDELRKTCECEENVEGIGEKEMREFKERCLTPMNGGDGENLWNRKTHRCNIARSEIDQLDDVEYEKWIAKCVVDPKLVLTKRLVIDEWCTVRQLRENTKRFRERCCDRFDTLGLSSDDRLRYTTICKSMQPNREECLRIYDKNLSPSSMKFYQEKCKCEQDLSSMSKLEHREFHVDCVIDQNSTKPIRNSERCVMLKNRIDSISVEEKRKFMETCVIDNEPFVWILDPECSIQDLKKVNWKKCLKKKSCNPEEMKSEEYQRICNDRAKICEQDLEEISKFEMETFVKKCVVDHKSEENCESIDVESLTESGFKQYQKKCGKNIVECVKRDTSKMRNKEFREFKKECGNTGVSAECNSINIDQLNNEELSKYREKCGVGEKIDCRVVFPNRLVGEEYETYRRECVRNHSTWNNEPCRSVDVAGLTESEYLEYREKCIYAKNVSTVEQRPIRPDESEMRNENWTPEEGVVLETNPGYGKSEVKSTIDCENIDVNGLTTEEYRQYEQKCLKKPNPENVKIEKSVEINPECENINPRKLNRKQFNNYKQKCLDGKTPGKLILSKSVEILESTTVSPATGIAGRVECDIGLGAIVKMTRDEKYQRKCGKKRLDCWKLGKLEDMSVEEERFYHENCVKSSPDIVKVENSTKKVVLKSPICFGKNLSEMSEKEYKKYLGECAICLENPEKLSKNEYEIFRLKCLEKTNIEKVLVIEKIPKKNECYNRDVDQMSEEEYSEYARNCLGLETKTTTPANWIIDCSHVVNPHLLSDEKYAEYIRRCRTTTSSPRRRGLRCGDVKNPKDLPEFQYQIYIRECVETPKTIKLIKKMEVVNDGKLGVTGSVVRIPIEEESGSEEEEDESEQVGTKVLIKTGTIRINGKGRVDVDENPDESGTIIVKKIVILREKNPEDGDEEDGENGKIIVSKVVTRNIPKRDDRDEEDTEEVVIKKQVGNNELLLLKVTRNKGRAIQGPGEKGEEGEEPNETVKIVRIVQQPANIRVKKHGQVIDVSRAVEEDSEEGKMVVLKKTVKMKRRVRKIRTTTTTTTIAPEPEYYYDTEDVPHVITIVKIVKPGRKTMRKRIVPMDEVEDQEKQEEQIEEPEKYDGFVSVHDGRLKISKEVRIEDSEENGIEESRKRIADRNTPSLQSIRLTSHRKKLQPLVEPEMESVDGLVTNVKIRRKVIKRRREVGEEEDGSEVDGVFSVRKHLMKMKGISRKVLDDVDDVEKVMIEGRIVVQRRKARKLRERKIPGIMLEESTTLTRTRLDRKGRQLTDFTRTIKRGNEKKMAKSDKLESVEQDGRDDEKLKESVRIVKTKKIYGERIGVVGEGPLEKKQMMVKKIRRFYKYKSDGTKELVRTEEVPMNDAGEIQRDQSGEDVKGKTGITVEDGSDDVSVVKKRFYRIGKDGKKILVQTKKTPMRGDGDELSRDELAESIKKEKGVIGGLGVGNTMNEQRSTTKSLDEQRMMSQRRVIKGKKIRRFYKIGKDGKRILTRTEELPNDEEKMVKSNQGSEGMHLGKILGSSRPRKNVGSERMTTRKYKEYHSEQRKSTKMMRSTRNGHTKMMKKEAKEESESKSLDTQMSRSVGRSGGAPKWVNDSHFDNILGESEEDVPEIAYETKQ